jgi:predicted nucleic acid-binding protein
VHGGQDQVIKQHFAGGSTGQDVLEAVRRADNTMDLLIATSAVVDDAVVVTANRRHFDVIPGLRVLGYRENAG